MGRSIRRLRRRLPLANERGAHAFQGRSPAERGPCLAIASAGACIRQQQEHEQPYDTYNHDADQEAKHDPRPAWFELTRHQKQT